MVQLSHKGLFEGQVDQLTIVLVESKEGKVYHQVHRRKLDLYQSVERTNRKF